MAGGCGPFRDLGRRGYRIHARERQLERKTERGAAANHLGLGDPGVGRVDVKPPPEPFRERVRHGGAELGRRIREWIVIQGAEHETADARPGAEHTRFAQQHDVAAREVHVLVGRVIRRRPSHERPVSGWIDVPHVDRERNERPQAKGRVDRRQITLDHVALCAFPCQADAHVDRLDIGTRGFFGEQHRAVKAS